MENKNNQQDKKKQLVVVVLIITIVAVIGYVVSGSSKGKSELKNELPLTEDNLTYCWEKEENEEEYRYTLDFCVGNEVIYARYTGDETVPSLVSIRSNYQINENMINISFELDGESFSETYYASVSAEKLILSQIEDGGTFLVGTYKNTQLAESETATVSDGVTDTTEINTSTETTQVSTTKAPTTVPATTKPPETEAPFSEPWRQAYADYAGKASKEGFVSFSLIYVDDDDIPELFLGGDCEATGERICTYKNGQIIEQNFPRLDGTSYIEKSGLIENCYGNMGCYGMDLYRLNNGKFEIVHSGYYEEGYSSLGEVYVTCYLDGREVEKTELDSTFAGSFDTNRATFAFNGAEYDCESFKYIVMGNTF